LIHSDKTREFIDKASKLHQGLYSYDKVDYLNSVTSVLITCDIHGEFSQGPASHLQGHGCPKCANEFTASKQRRTQDAFIKAAREIHGDLYDYSKVAYVNNTTKVELGCNCTGKFHTFPITPKHHISRSQGCSILGRKKANLNHRLGLEDFKKQCSEIHNNFYDYSKVNLVLLSDKITVTCPSHGDFTQLASSHRSGTGCQKCFDERRSSMQTNTTEEFIQKALRVHEDSPYGPYSYEYVNYQDAKTKVNIFCNKHGLFEQTPDGHINGYGCKACSHILSKAQVQIEMFVKSLNVEVVRDFKLGTNLEIDVYCPEYNIGFEYNGLRYHGEKFKKPDYHESKSQMALDEGIRLIHIWEDEWLASPDKVKNLIANTLGKATLKHNARQCEVKVVPWSIAGKFLDEVHLQGACAPTKLNYGLYKGQELVSIMAFTRATSKDTREVELMRFASKGIVRGGFTKMLSAFIREHSKEFDSIISFSERRWSVGGIYALSGFEHVGVTERAYWWCKTDKRYHRRGFQHKYLSEKFENYDPDKTEVENCHANGYFRIWDCGKDKWKLTIR
jgi:hypothetical protein